MAQSIPAINKRTATEIAKDCRDGITSVSEVADAVAQRVNERQSLSAWDIFDEKQVAREVKRLEALPEQHRGRLYGVPVAVKDIIYTQDLPTLHGSNRCNDPATFDAAVVAVLRQAGCIIAGKTVTTEFANTMNGRATQNPLNVGHTPGGSSSGSAAAVADYHVPISIGTQTIGSVVRPASFCGIFGFKPTYGLIPIWGTRGYAPTLDTIGFFSRSVVDQLLIAEAFGLSQDAPSIFEGLEGAKFAVCKPAAVWDRATPDGVQALEAAVDLLRQQGCIVEELQLPDEFAGWPEWSRQIYTKEVYVNMRSETIFGTDDIDGMILGHIAHGAKVSMTEYRIALDTFSHLRSRFDEMAAGYDAIITLGAPGEAPAGLHHTGDASFCSLWTTLHVPAINVPGFGGSSGLPIGIQLVSSRFRDMHLLAVAEKVGQLFAENGNWRSAI